MLFNAALLCALFRKNNIGNNKKITCLLNFGKIFTFINFDFDNKATQLPNLFCFSVYVVIWTQLNMLCFKQSKELRLHEFKSYLEFDRANQNLEFKFLLFNWFRETLYEVLSTLLKIEPDVSDSNEAIFELDAF